MKTLTLEDMLRKEGGGVWLGKIAEVKKSAVCLWRSGRRRPMPYSVMKLERHFGCKLILPEPFVKKGEL